MSDIEFARGFYFNAPPDNAPDWVVGKVSINREQFLGWLEAQEPNEKGYIRLDIKRSKKGEVYAALDTWQPAGGSKTRSDSQPYTSGRSAPEVAQGGFDDDLPFAAHERGWLV